MKLEDIEKINNILKEIKETEREINSLRNKGNLYIGNWWESFGNTNHDIIFYADEEVISFLIDKLEKKIEYLKNKLKELVVEV